MVTHKEALENAHDAYLCAKYSGYRGLDGSPLEAAIRAYLDARGLVMVPRELTTHMIGVFHKKHRLADAWSAMLAAAPDPFGDAE